MSDYNFLKSDAKRPNRRNEHRITIMDYDAINMIPTKKSPSPKYDSSSVLRLSSNKIYSYENKIEMKFANTNGTFISSSSTVSSYISTNFANISQTESILWL